MTADRTDKTNTIEVVRAPQRMVAIPAGRGIWVGQDLLAPPSAPVDGDVVVRLHRGDEVSDNVVIPVEQEGLPTATLAETEVTVTPDNVVFTFPAGATFTNQVVASLTATVESDGSPGAGTWGLLAAPDGYSLSSTTGLTTNVLYTGARPTGTASFLAQYNVPASASATGDGNSAVITTGIVAPPMRTDAEIDDITRTDLNVFTQAITQLFSGSVDSYQVISSNLNVSLVSLTDANVASFSPQADGVTTITVIAINNGGTAQYEFQLTIDILLEATIVWPSDDYDTGDSRYEFLTPPSPIGITLATLLPQVSAPSPGVLGTVSFSVSSAYAGVVDWSPAGVLSIRAGFAANAGVLDGELVVTVAGSTTVRANTFRRAVRITVRPGAAPPTGGITANPVFAPAGGLVRTVRVGEFFDIDFTGSLVPADAIVRPVATNGELISVSLRAGDVVRCTGLRVGSTTYIVSGVWVVRVTVVAAGAAPTATTSAWYRRTGESGSYVYTAINSLSLDITENAAAMNLLGGDPLYLEMTQIGARTVTLQEQPQLAGLDVIPSAGIISFSLADGTAVVARQINISGDGTDFDYETRNSYAVNLLGVAETDIIGGTTYSAHTARLPIALAIQDVFEPTAAPSFGEAVTEANLTAGSDGTKDGGVSVGTWAATQGATITSDLPNLFSVDNSGEVKYIGAISSAYVGQSWTLTLTATNALGSVTLQILINVKAAVTLSISPTRDPGWKLPTGATAIELGTFTVESTSNDRNGFPPAPTVAISGADADNIRAVPSSANDFTISYVGAAKDITAADLEYTLTANSAETGLCLAAAPVSLSFVSEVVPRTPVFAQTSYDYTVEDGATPPVAVGMPTASKSTVETQRWRIISGNTDTQRLYSVLAADGQISFAGPSSPDLDTTASYTLTVGVVNIQGSKESREATAIVRIAVVSPYAAPTENGAWSPGASWTRQADGSFSGSVVVGQSVTVDITAGATGPYTIQSGRTASYSSETIPSPATDFSVTQTDGSFAIAGVAAGTETLHLLLSDGRTTETIVFHVAVVAAATTTASQAVWYTDGPGITYVPIDEKGLSIGFPEGQTTPISRNIYVTFTEIASRSNATLAEPTQAGFDIVQQLGFRRSITIGSVSTFVQAYQINIDPRMFDYETQSRFDLIATLNAPQATVSGTTYSAVHKPVHIRLDVSNVNEPPNRSALAAPSDFELRRGGHTFVQTLGGYWTSEDNPDANRLSYRLVQTVVGAGTGQSTNAADYLTAEIIAGQFQASAGQAATLTPTGVTIRFDIYCREASTGVENGTPLSFSCDAVHARALEDSVLAWASGVPARLEFSVAENVALPHLLRNDIYAESTVVDMTAEAGALSYSLEEPTSWIERNPAFSWTPLLTLTSGGSQTINMRQAFRIAGTDTEGVTWTLSAQSVTDSSVATISFTDHGFTITGSSTLAAEGSTNFVISASDGTFVETYTGNVTVAAMASTPAPTGVTFALPTSTPSLLSSSYNTAGLTYSGTGSMADPFTVNGLEQVGVDSGDISILDIAATEFFSAPSGTTIVPVSGSETLADGSAYDYTGPLGATSIFTATNSFGIEIEGDWGTAAYPFNYAITLSARSSTDTTDSDTGTFYLRIAS